MMPPRDGNDWTTDGPNILSREQLAVIEASFEKSFLIVERRFYNGASALDARLFQSFEDFEDYLRTEVRPGDSIWCWSYELCREDNSLAHGKYPDEQGRVPRGGAY